MPVFELGYRPFEGELSRGNRVLAIAWSSVLVRVRWWSWLLFAVAWLVPHLFYAMLIVLVTVVARFAQQAGQAAGALTAPTVAFGQTGQNFGPGQVIAALTTNSPYLFWDVLQNASIWNAVVPAVICAGILASDRRTGALQIYFARPVTRRDYLVAKALAVAAFSFLVTGLPVLLLWCQACAFSADATFFYKTWWAPFSILGASCFYALWTTSIILALSSMFKRPVFVGIAALVSYLLRAAVSLILENHFENPAWRFLQDDYLLGYLTAPLFGLDLPPELTPVWPLAAGVVVPALLLWFVWWRLRAVEVHT